LHFRYLGICFEFQIPGGRTYEFLPNGQKQVLKSHENRGKCLTRTKSLFTAIGGQHDECLKCEFETLISAPSGNLKTDLNSSTSGKLLACSSPFREHNPLSAHLDETLAIAGLTLFWMVYHH